MSDTPVNVFIDCSKPIGEQETIVPLTAEELAQAEALRAEMLAAEAAAKAEADAKAAAKAAVLAALADAAGLSVDDVTAALSV